MPASITDDRAANGLAGNSASTGSFASAFNPVTGGAGTSFTLGNVTDPTASGWDWNKISDALGTLAKPDGTTPAQDGTQQQSAGPQSSAVQRRKSGTPSPIWCRCSPPGATSI